MADRIVKQSVLTAKLVRELLHYDVLTGVFRWKVDRMCGRYHKQFAARAGDIAGNVCKDGRVQIGILDRRFRAHRVAWLYVYGEWVPEIDHIDGNNSNNAILNLRIADRFMNMQNLHKAKKQNACGFLGVRKHHLKFVAQISVRGKYTYLGLFGTPELAHGAYLKAKREMHEGCTI